MVGTWLTVHFKSGTSLSHQILVRDMLQAQGFVYSDKPYQWGGPFKKTNRITLGARSRNYGGFSPNGAGSYLRIGFLP
jgi:hypothetical protein